MFRQRGPSHREQLHPDRLLTYVYPAPAITTYYRGHNLYVMATSPELQQSPPIQLAGGSNLSSPPPPSPAPDWGSDPVPLKDFASKREVPGFAKVVKGSYMTLGASKFSLTKQHQEVFVHSVKVSVKVLAHCLKRVETTSVARRGSHNIYTTTRLYAVDQRLAIPISYQGWFELLSEDGKSARPISTVHELSKVKPHKVLVRENMKCYLLSEDGKLTFDKTKIVIAGEQLILNGEISLPSTAEGKKVKLLRCVDTNQETLFLSFDQKGTFTPIAGENDFTGVFSIRDVVRRFRLPLTVKLVQGVRPKVDTSRFTGLVRLDWVYTDETAFVCPIEKNHVRLLPVPTDANLQLCAATNQQAMKATELYRTMMTKCSRMITNYNNTLHLIVQVPDAAAKGNKGRVSNANMFSVPFESDSGAVKSSRSRQRENRLMAEIDDLYGYVRDGGAIPSTVKFSYDSDEESYWEEPAYEPLDEFRARLKALEAGERVSYPAKYQPQDISTLNLDTAAEPASNRSVANSNGLVNGSSGGSTVVVSSSSTMPVSAPPPLPPRNPDQTPSPSSSTTGGNQSNGREPETRSSPIVAIPPAIPPRRYSQGEAVTTVSNLGMVSSSQVSLHSRGNYGKTPPKTHGQQAPKTTRQNSRDSGDPQSANKRNRFLHSKSAGSQDSNSNSGGSSSNGQQRRHIARDFKDSDISSMTRGGSSGGSSGGHRVTSNVRKKLQTLYL